MYIWIYSLWCVVFLSSCPLCWMSLKGCWELFAVTDRHNILFYSPQPFDLLQNHCQKRLHIFHHVGIIFIIYSAIIFCHGNKRATGTRSSWNLRPYCIKLGHNSLFDRTGSAKQFVQAMKCVHLSEKCVERTKKTLSRHKNSSGYFCCFKSTASKTLLPPCSRRPGTTGLLQPSGSNEAISFCPVLYFLSVVFLL